MNNTSHKLFIFTRDTECDVFVYIMYFLEMLVNNCEKQNAPLTRNVSSSSYWNI